MSTRHPQAGDGIVEIATDRKHVVRGRKFNGFVSGTPTEDDKDVIGVVIIENGKDRTLLNGSYRLQSWYEIIRPTGFGRTSWVAFSFIQAMVIGIVSAGVATIDEAGWVAFLMAAAIEAVLVIWSHRNYTGKTR